MTTSDQLYFRQFLVGRDLAPTDHFATAMANYVYAIGDRESGEVLIVDAAYAPAELVKTLAEDNMTIAGALVTHYHADHTGGVIFDHRIAGLNELLAVCDVPVHIQQSELQWIEESTGLDSSVFALHQPGDIVRIGDISVTCIHTPGHTPGSQCFLINNVLLTGDTLFLNGCGRTDLPGGDAQELYETLTKRLDPLSNETTIFPGHAYDPEPSASLGVLRQTNPVLTKLPEAEWRSRFAP